MRRAIGLLLALAACGNGDGAAPTPDAALTPDLDAALPSFEVNATLVPAMPEGILHSGRREDGTAILPGGRRMTPAGEHVEVGGWLLGMRVLPGGRHLVTSDAAIDDEFLSVVDLPAKKVVQREAFAGRDGKALFLGLAVRSDGALFASGGGSDRIYRYRYDPNAAAPLSPDGEIQVRGGSYVAGLAFVDDFRLLAAYQTGYAVGLVDSRDGSELGRLPLLGEQPYDLVVDALRQEAWVSVWGADSVSVIAWDGGTLRLLGKVVTGKNPEGLLLFPPAAPEKLLVANSDTDSVTVIDLDTRLVEKQIAVAPPERPMRGVTPTGLALSPDGQRLYVVVSGDNALDVYETQGWTRLGKVPTTFYPTSVTVLDDGRIAYASAKGLGAGAWKGTPGDNTLQKGTVSLLAAPATADLVAGETQVEANNLRMTMVGPRVACPESGECRWPLPPRNGLPTPIEHVVLIVRENKTYDAALGDLAGSEAAPELVIFGERFTPNLHALARGFVNGDNFYSNAEASIQGHHWTTSATTTDYIEKAWLTIWGRGTRAVTDAAQALAAPEAGSYFQILGRAGISYVSYGEVVGAGGQRPDDPPFAIDRQWPGGIYFNLDTTDVSKAIYLEEKIVKNGVMPRFSYVMLPNNHTSGTTPGRWTPEYMVADNDEATGRVVDTITRSRFWPRTAIFIIEDDPSDGYDHIDAHRSTLVVVSPWVKRGTVTKVNYDFPAVWRTIEMLLGLPPMTQQTATASPMFDLWSQTPDYSGYRFIPSNLPEARNPPRSGKQPDDDLDFSRVDNAPGLGKLLWRHMRGTDPPWELPWDPDGDGDGDDD